MWFRLTIIQCGLDRMCVAQRAFNMREFRNHAMWFRLTILQCGLDHRIRLVFKQCGLDHRIRLTIKERGLDQDSYNVDQIMMFIQCGLDEL